MSRLHQLLGRSALVFGLAVAGGTAAVISEPHPDMAQAVTFTNDYPYMNANVLNQANSDYWVDEDANGSYSGAAELLSPRLYNYRNCTDGAAHWVASYTDVSIGTDWGNAENWETGAAADNYTVKAGNSTAIEPGDIAQSDDGAVGHVGFVTSVTKNATGAVTQIMVAQLNAATTGEYSHVTYTGKNASGNFIRPGTNRDWDHFIDPNGIGKGLDNDVIAGGSSGSTTLARPAAISFNGALNVFIRGGDNQIYNQYWNGSSWTGYSTIGGNIAGDPAVIINGNALNVFARDAGNNQIYTKFNNGTGWSSWASMGSTQMKGSPRVVQYGSELDIFALGTDNHPYKNTWNGSSWGGWSSLGNYMDSSPAPVVYGSELSVFMRGGDANVYKDTWNGSSWSGFSGLAANSTLGNPDAISYAGQMSVWTNTTVNNLFQRTWNGSAWGSWTDMGGDFHGDPDVMQYNSDLEVFARAADGVMYTRYWSANGQNWSSWASIDTNTPVAGDPTAIQYGSELDVFAVGSDGKTYKNTWNGSAWGGFTALPG